MPVLARQLEKTTECLYSFDIFDTLVTRRVATPEDIFLLIQYKLTDCNNIPDFIKNNFFLIRKEAEAYTRLCLCSDSSNSIREVTFDEIYETIKNSYKLNDEQITLLKELEIDTELKNLVPVQKNIDLLKSYVQSSHKVVLISDMYLPQRILRKMLTHIDCVFSDITIYVSSDYFGSKSDGELFDIVKNKEKIEYSNWTHYGDNIQSDFRVPALKGIKSVLVKPDNNLKLLKYLKKQNSNSLFFSYVLGSVKLALFENSKNSKSFSFGASFSAPLLYSYVSWIINCALENNLKTLHFIARDGYFPKMIADLIIKERNLDIKTKYIYGSRIAFRIPNKDSFDEFINTVCIKEYSYIDLKTLCYRFQIDVKEFCNLLEIDNSLGNLSKKQRCLIADKIKNNLKVRNYFINLFEERRELLKEYFKQQIDYSQEEVYFVDLHGSGKTQDYVSDILNEIKDCTVVTLYMTNCFGKQNAKSIKLSYFSTINYMSHWVELLSRTKYGQTIGFKRNNDIIEPVVENIGVNSKWNFDDYQNGILAYVKHILDFENRNDVSFNSLDLYCRYYDYLTKKADKQLAEAIGSIPFSAIGEETSLRENSPEISLPEALFTFVSGKKLCKHPEFYFISAARSSFICSILLKMTEKYKTLRKFLIDVYINKRKKQAYIRFLGVKISLSFMIGLF